MCVQNDASTVTGTNKFKSNPSMRLGLILGGLIALVAILAALSKMFKRNK